MNKKLRPILVNERDGSYYVMDGKHHTMAYQQMGMEKVPCLVSHGFTESEEALTCYFANKQTIVTGWTNEELENCLHVAYPLWDEMTDAEKVTATRLEYAPQKIQELLAVYEEMQREL